MKRSYSFKAVGVLIILVFVFALPVMASATNTGTVDNVGQFLDRIPGFLDSDVDISDIPDIPTDLEPGTFYINMFAYEQSVLADEKFALIISYAYSNQSLSPAYDPTLTITLSEEIKYIEFYDQSLQTIPASVQILPSGEQAVTFALEGPIAAGTIGNIIAVVKLDGELLDSTDTPYASAQIEATNTDTASTGNVFVDPITNPSDWMMMLYRDYPTDEPAPDGEAIYGITLYGNSEDNGLNLSNVQIELSYPAGTVILDAGSGAVNESAHTITWQHGDLLIEEMAEYWITLRYPAQNYTNATANTGGKINTVHLEAKATANVDGMEGTFDIESVLDHGFAASSVKLGALHFGESLNEDSYTAGELAEFTIYGMENKGNVNFEKASIVVDVPEDLFLQYVDTGEFNMDVNVKIQYKVDGVDGWQDWATVSSLKSQRLYVSGLDFIIPIDKIRWVFTEGNETIKPGFTGRDTIRFGANVIGNYGNNTDVSALLQASSHDGNSTSGVSGDVLKIRTIMPDNLPTWRKNIVDTAFTLQGKVEYYLGGKSYVIGWDDRWGKVRYNSNSAKTEPYGLDCSGYVVWVLINAGFDPTNVRANFGIATYYQWPNCEPLSVDDLLPGDMVFRQPPTAAGMNHVGIVVGKDKQGTILVAHCAGSYNTVVVTPYDGTFHYMRRPYIYKEY